MGVSAYHRRHPPIKVPAHGDLLGGRLGMNLDKYHVYLVTQLLEHSISRSKGTIALQSDKTAPEYREKPHSDPVLFQNKDIATRTIARQVGRTTDILESVDFLFESPLIPHMIT
jgi:hypothetical protein